jgi:hypothetical protein
VPTRDEECCEKRGIDSLNPGSPQKPIGRTLNVWGAMAERQRELSWSGRRGLSPLVPSTASNSVIGSRRGSSGWL